MSDEMHTVEYEIDLDGVGPTATSLSARLQQALGTDDRERIEEAQVRLVATVSEELGLTWDPEQRTLAGVRAVEVDAEDWERAQADPLWEEDLNRRKQLEEPVEDLESILDRAIEQLAAR